MPSHGCCVRGLPLLLVVGLLQPDLCQGTLEHLAQVHGHQFSQLPVQDADVLKRCVTYLGNPYASRDNTRCNLRVGEGLAGRDIVQTEGPGPPLVCAVMLTTATVLPCV